MVRLAWILYALSVLIGSGMVLVTAIKLRHAFPNVSAREMAGTIAFVLGLFSNILFWPPTERGGCRSCRRCGAPS